MKDLFKNWIFWAILVLVIILIVLGIKRAKDKKAVDEVIINVTQSQDAWAVEWRTRVQAKATETGKTFDELLYPEAVQWAIENKGAWKIWFKV
jgi:hypothetical protein